VICSRRSIPHLCSVCGAWGNRNPHVLVTFAPKVTPAQRDKDSAHAPKQRFFDSFHSLRMTEQKSVLFYNGRIISAPTQFLGCFGTSRTPSPTQLYKNVTIRKIPICQTIIARVYIVVNATLYVIKQRIISVLKFMQKNKKQ
jgi:hypothetical protein